MSSVAMQEGQQTENEIYSYDELPYPSHPFEVTHPDHLYALAKLFGLKPAVPDNASFLELGCASGGNIIPIAVQMPGCRCVGVDLSSKQIAEGQQTVEALGLTNMRLVAEDLKNVDESYGQFDYIVCHGVFSWVPDEIQHRILEICRERLSPQGVAYISYNAYPGWFMRGMIRQMMLHHVKNLTEPKQKIQQARALLSFIVDSTEGQNTPYANVLKQELDLLGKHADSYLFHEHLEENNRPMFFYEFVEMAKKHELQFLGESNLASMITSNLPPKAAEALTKLTTDIHHRSQYTDFVTNRMFRQSILCHDDVKVVRHIDQASISDARFAGSFTLEDAKQQNELSPEIEVTFKCSNGRGLKSKNAALKAMLFALADAWPRSLSLAEIREAVEKRLTELLVVGEPEQVSVANMVQVNIMQMLVRGDIEYRFFPDRFTTTVSERPTVSSLNRLQAKSGNLLTTQRHSMLNADPLTRLLIQELDGSKTRDDLVAYMGKLAAEGKINVNVKGDAPKDMTAIHRAAVDKVLEQVRRSAVLIA